MVATQTPLWECAPFGAVFFLLAYTRRTLRSEGLAWTRCIGMASRMSEQVNLSATARRQIWTRCCLLDIYHRDQEAPLTLGSIVALAHVASSAQRVTSARNANGWIIGRRTLDDVAFDFLGFLGPVLVCSSPTVRAKRRSGC